MTETFRRHKVFETADPDHAVEIFDRLYGKQKYDIERPAATPNIMSLAAMNIANSALCHFKTSYDLVIEKERPGPCFGLSFATVGHWRLRLGARSEISAYGAVGCIVPQDREVKAFLSAGECLSLMVPRSTITAGLEALIGRAVAAPIEFEPIVDSGRGGAGMLHSSIDLIARELAEPASPLGHPAIAARLEEFIVNTLLHGLSHNYADAIAAGGRMAAPKQVRRAEAFIEAHAEEPIRLADIAQWAGCSVRALQLAFKRFRDTTPMALLKQIRLERARRELSRSDAVATTVTEVAVRLGFYNAGRFARDYKMTFGETPSETLRFTSGHRGRASELPNGMPAL